jgi:ribosomal protein S18 acetylase RimI-like enzyme
MRLTMAIRQAKPADQPGILALIRSCVRHMESQGIDQWDDLYPDEATIRRDIDANELYLLEQDGRLGGIITLNESQEPAYQEVAWQFGGRALVVHRLAIDPSSQGKGFAGELMQFAYTIARERQYATIRLDAFTHNPRAVALYEGLGYQRAGMVTFRKGLFICFEIQVR